MKNKILKHISVFLAIFIAGLVWTAYIKSIANNNALYASILDSIIYILSAYSIISYTKEKIYLISAVFGAFCGTYVAMIL